VHGRPSRRHRFEPDGRRVDEVMAAHLQEAAVVDPLLAHEDRVHRRLHVVVDPARAGALEEGEGPIVGIEHHLLALARIGAHEHHAAVAETDMSHLHGDRHAVDQHDLVAPVELVCLARLEAQRHEGGCRRLARSTLPAGCVPTDRIVAAVVAERSQLLEDPGERQAFAHRPRRIGRQQALEIVPPRPDLRLRLHPALVLELRRARPDDLPHRVPRDVQLPADLLDRLAADEELPANPGDRVHALHPPPTHPDHRTGRLAGAHQRGSILDADPPAQGVNIPRRSTLHQIRTGNRSGEYRP